MHDQAMNDSQRQQNTFKLTAKFDFACHIYVLAFHNFIDEAPF